MKHHVVRTICTALTLIVPAAMAGTVDDYFAEGVLGFKWDTTLQQVQEKFPGGVTFPTAAGHEGTRLTYQATIDSKAIGIELPPSIAMFDFTSSEKLRNVSFHFAYAVRDTVLYQVAKAIGQDYSSSSDEWEDVYRWKRGRTSSVALSIGRDSPHTWVYLNVWAERDVQRKRQ